ncbi:hypothetical protein Q0590_36090 [Rhodocytophaga aerolata]|uniref:Uncharacterized protein n=1 Tax=Rhodocytophaga aerolata TaxID=455078 RepID=A0ABT8RJ24_9BACT|nr:hypothetical protein [Rhodocytophaga aerolata]MDO1451751.1 hypothetical protein [Rhodocytophaga aerolata]
MNLVNLQWWHPRVRPDKQQDLYWDSLIHPEDLVIAYEYPFQSSIFYVEMAEGDYIFIKQNNFRLRVKASALQLVVYEGFYMGNKVQVVSKNGANSVKEGIIKSMAFHFKANRLFYLLTDLTGRAMKKRYFSDDLKRIKE